MNGESNTDGLTNGHADSSPRVFPQSRHPLFNISYQQNEDQLPPDFLKPIFDTLTLRDPLLPFNRLAQAEYFGGSTNPDVVPPRPPSWHDQYLHPTLSEHEYDRLMLLWYYTKGIEDDTDLLNKLSHMLDILKTSMGWEIGIVGLVEAEHFIKIAAKNVALAVSPRKESTCSHTITHEPGTVFTIPDMSTDWRFVRSPPVADGGLKSYAGTQLRLPLPNGKEIAFGSLCLASLQKRRPLTAKQNESLVRAADVITGEIVTSKRLKRLQEKQSMVENLSALRSKAHVECVEAEVMRELSMRYPSCSPTVARVQADNLGLPSGERVPLSVIQDGLWEDTPFINKVIKSGDFERAIKERKIRLIAAPITPNERYMVLTTSKLRDVFDDLDVWFIDQCAQVINTSAQAQLLREALAAKSTFLRTVTHELRTPIHAILSSVELANEDIKSNEKHSEQAGASGAAASLAPFLDTIRQSGTELMTTVNNILRLNAFESDMKSYPSDYDLRAIETDVLSEVFQNYTDSQLPALSVLFQNKIPDSKAMARIDGDLLKEMLKCLLFNSISATSRGSIRVKVSFVEEDAMIHIDVVDTGIGIKEADQSRIFQAFEKVDIHSSGAGLGLSLASQMASTLHGDLSLVYSKPDHGSHFRVRVPHVATMASNLSTRDVPFRKRHLPSTFNVIQNSDKSLHLIDHLENYLTKCEFQKSDVVQGSIIILNQPGPLQSINSAMLGNLDGPHVILYVCDTPITPNLRKCVQDDFKGHVVHPITGPFFASRLDELFVEIDSGFAAYRKEPECTQARLEDVSAANTDDCNTGSFTVAMKVDLTLPIMPSSSPKPVVRALLVDDNSVNLSVLKMYCKRRGIPYGTAVNGEEAVQQYCQSVSTSGTSSSPYTLILMDLQMPKCDGIEASRQIRSHEQEHNLQPSILLILTGQDSVADRRDAFQAGIDDYYVKPVSVKKLDQAVAQFFPESPG